MCKSRIAALVALAFASSVNAVDQKDLALSFMSLGGDLATMAWNGPAPNKSVDPNSPDFYRNLGDNVKGQLDSAKYASETFKDTGGLVATTFDVAQTLDPEPVTRFVLFAASAGVRSGANALASKMYEQSSGASLTLMANVLQDHTNHLNLEEFKNASPDVAVAEIGRLRVGAQTLEQTFSDNPRALSVVTATVQDYLLASHQNDLKHFQKIDGSISDLTGKVKDVSQKLDTFVADTKEKLTSIESNLQDLDVRTTALTQKTADLQDRVGNDERAMQTLRDISASGWTTDQKLEALKGGLYSDLTDDQRGALTAQLAAAKSREDTIQNLSTASQGLQLVGAVAAKLGVNKDVVQGIQTSSVACQALSQAVSGNYFGAAMTALGIFGGGGGDPTAAAFANLQAHIDARFDHIDAQLNNIQQLQEKTLDSIAALSKQTAEFEKHVQGHLDQIEYDVLTNQQMLGHLVRNEWASCNSLVTAGADPTGIAIWFSSRQQLVDNVLTKEGPAVQGAQLFRRDWSACTEQLHRFDSDLLQGQIAGSLLDLRAFPQSTSEPGLPKAEELMVLAQRRSDQFAAARDLFAAKYPDYVSHPLPYLTRIWQPSTTVDSMLQTASVIRSVSTNLNFDCGKASPLSNAQMRIVCFSDHPSSEPPSAARIGSLFGTRPGFALIGPYDSYIISRSVFAGRVGALTYSPRDENSWLTPDELDATSIPNSPALAHLQRAAAEKNGLLEIQTAMIVADLGLFQQSLANGDMIAELVADTLYNASTGQWTTAVDNASTSPANALQHAALQVIKLNPIVARNAVLIAVRRTLEQSGHYSPSLYLLGMNNYKGDPACDDVPEFKARIAGLLPGWPISYRQPEGKANGKQCGSTPGIPEFGYGPVITFTLDAVPFYVRLPSPAAVQLGQFEVAPGIVHAQQLKNFVAEAIVDRNVSVNFKTTAEASAKDHAWGFLQFATKKTPISYRDAPQTN